MRSLGPRWYSSWHRLGMALQFCMAILRIKGTYSLDADTVRTLESLAKRWRTSRSDVLRRAIRAAALGTEEPPDLAALDRLQQRVALTEAKAGRWAAAARDERRAR